jgi:ubiquinone/menaquinone biosynthesis C-methylase UbiE
MKRYYRGKHATRYNRTWQTFLQKTLDAACGMIDAAQLQQKDQMRQRPLRILDTACGTGLLLERLLHIFPSAELYGIDASAEMLAQAHHLLHSAPNIHLSQGVLNAEATAGLAYPSAFFDLITCTNALHYLQEPIVVLKRFRDLLAEQGQLVLEDYTLRGNSLLWGEIEWAIRIYDPEHRSLYTKAEAQRLCQQAGLQVDAARTFPIGFFCQGWAMRALS